MKRLDIFIAVFAEASGKPESEVREMAKLFADQRPSFAGGMDRELSKDEAANLMAGLRSELPAIRAWFLEGAMRMTAKKPT